MVSSAGRTMIPRNKCLMIAVICFLLCSVSIANAIEPDKKLHYGVSVPCGIVGAAIIESCCSDWPWYYQLPAAVGIGLIPGITKEGIDQITYGGWDNEDLLADALGSTTGSILYFTVEW